MFVETMTFEEMRKEYDKDQPAIHRKLNSHSDLVLKQMRKTNMSRLYKEYDWISPLKNRWTYIFDFDLSRKTTKFTFPLYCIFFREKNYSVISCSEKNVLYYTSHFFTRYFEREGLQKDSIHETVKTFLRRNAGMVIQKERHIFDNRWDVFIQLQEGVAFGTMYEKIGFVEFRTFITNDMLKGKQIDLSKNLTEKIPFQYRKKEEEK